jgi:meso-butanediol dehydrogenase/(S,S)-butanediol dehydrogenase/diacetyl reductase
MLSTSQQQAREQHMSEITGTAIVTGAGSGIGAGIAAHFAQSGINVLAVDRNADGFARFDGNAKVRCHVCDVTASDAPASIFRRCRDEFGEPDFLINNAGRGNAKSARDTTDEEFDAYVAINLRSVFRLSREFISTDSEKERAIVNIASVFGSVGFPGTAPYGATKAGVIGLTHQMAADYGPIKVRINAIAPGLIATPATADRMANNPRYRALTIDQIPAGRAGTPEDIAAVALFLCSPGASYVSGQVITVDGGWTATRYHR